MYKSAGRSTKCQRSSACLESIDILSRLPGFPGMLAPRWSLRAIMRLQGDVVLCIVVLL
jgi:hypothetical protein